MSSEIRRDENGRFLKGNPGGPGRPPVERERLYTETMVEVCTADDWREICLRAIADAKNGDHRAREWLAKYLIGDPQFVSNVLHVHQEVRERENPFDHASDEALLAAMTAIDHAERESRAAMTLMRRSPRITD